jgi:lambda repressor-like predicted transcriptional regulator
MNNSRSKINIYQKEKRTWDWIKHRLSFLDSSFSKLAKLHGVTKQNFAIVKHFPYPKYEILIAEKLGLKAWALWPERYNANHDPNRISSRYQSHKYFLNNTQNEVKRNGKDNHKSISESAE